MCAPEHTTVEIVEAEPTATATPTARNEKRAVRSVYFLSTYAAGASTATAIHTPSIISSSVLGAHSHTATTKLVYMSKAALPTLASSMLSRNIEPALQNDYPAWNGSGYLNVRFSILVNIEDDC